MTRSDEVFDVVREAGSVVATDGHMVVTGLDGASAFKRTGIKIKLAAESEKSVSQQWLVVQLDGVAVYARTIDGLPRVVVSRGDGLP